MASVSASTLIIFIASILVAASVAGTMTTGVSQLGDALGDRSLDVANEIRTDIDIISDPGSTAVYDGDTTTITLLVKNTGSKSLSTDPKTIDVIIDGEYTTDVSTSLVGDENTWREGSVLQISVDKQLDPGEHRVVVMVNDDRETFEFWV